jgi:hypothetical protein
VWLQKGIQVIHGRQFPRTNYIIDFLRERQRIQAGKKTGPDPNHSQLPKPDLFSTPRDMPVAP